MERPVDMPAQGLAAAVWQQLFPPDSSQSLQNRERMLARTLLERAEQDPRQPMPVVLNLSTWTEEQSPFADWLVAELNIRYDVPKRIGKGWVEENKLTLLLDGLDELAQSPLMLNVICIAYRDTEAAEVKAAKTVDTRHSQLFDIYVQKMLARRGEHEEYSAGQTLHWLTWLARGMVAKNQTTFLIERLQPDWLTTAKQRAAYSWSMRVIIGLALAIVLAVTFANRSESPTSGITYGFVAGLILLIVWERVPPITLPRLGNLKLGLVEGFTFGLLFWLARSWQYLPLR